MISVEIDRQQVFSDQNEMELGKLQTNKKNEAFFQPFLFTLPIYRILVTYSSFVSSKLGAQAHQAILRAPKTTHFYPPPPLPHCHSAVRFISLAARDYKQPANISRKRKNKTYTKHGTTSSQFANAHNIFVLNARTEHGPPFNSI